MIIVLKLLYRSFVIVCLAMPTLSTAQSVFPDSICQQPFEISGKRCGYYAGEFRLAQFDHDGGKMLAIVSEKEIPADLQGVMFLKEDLVAFMFVTPNSEGENAMLLGPKFSAEQVKFFEGKDRIAFFQTRNEDIVAYIIIELKIVNSAAGLPS